MLHVSQIEFINGTKSKPVQVKKVFDGINTLDKYRKRLERIYEARKGYKVSVAFRYVEK